MTVQGSGVIQETELLHHSDRGSDSCERLQFSWKGDVIEVRRRNVGRAWYAGECSA
jgi:hypothetical protein